MIVDRLGNPIVREHQSQEFREIAWADPLHLFADQPTQYNPNILVTRRGLRIFDQIRRDDQVKAALSFKKHALMSTGWHLESPPGKPDDWEPTVFIEEQLNALEGTFKEALLQILTALDYGYSCSEKIHKEDGAHVNLAAIKTRAPHSIEFATDEYGNLLPNGIMQTDRGDAGNVYMPRKKFVLLQYQKEFGNPYGTSDLDASYRGWWGKDNAYKWMMMLLERHGIPPIFALYNSARYKGAALTDLQNIISALQASTTGTIPRSDEKDLELWAPELAGQISSVFIPAMKMLNEDLARSILMPGLMGLTPEQSSGSLARARVIFDVFILVVDFLRTTVEERVVDEQIIRPLVAMNFAVDEFPTFHFNPLTEDSRTELLKAWAELVGVSAVLNTKDDEDHIRQLLEFPEREGEEPAPEPEDEPETEPEPEDEPEIGQLAQFAALTGRQPEGEPIRRQKTEAEKSVNFAEIDRRLDGLEQRAVDSLVATIKAIQTTMTNRLRKMGSSVAVPKVMPGQKADIQGALKELTDDAAKFGSKTVRQELPRQMQEPVTASPVEAIEYLDQKNLWITEVLTENLVNEARAAMLKSIELGETTQAAMERLREVFLPYIGSGQIRVEGELLTPHRIETIVRTNTTDAFSKGRVTEIMRPEYDGIVDYVQYSAIRDTRTTRVCRKLDKKVFRRDDPALQELLPPRHYNCRSIPVPLGPEVEVDQNDIVDTKTAAQAKELSGKGFK